MEIRNNPVLCPKCGNYYNPAFHGSCPHCDSLEATGDLGVTTPVGGPIPDEGGAVMGGVTEPVNDLNERGGFTPFSEPTQVGGGLDAGGTDPVVGWLVCIEGPMRGNDYRLHAGYNYIGREVGDIRIRGDLQISRENHAMIAYDETELMFYIGPAAGRNLIKVNGKTVMNAVELKNYDVISIGSTKLIFAALCGESFSWK